MVGQPLVRQAAPLPAPLKQPPAERADCRPSEARASPTPPAACPVEQVRAPKAASGRVVAAEAALSERWVVPPRLVPRAA